MTDTAHTTPTAPSNAPARRGWTPGRVTALVLSSGALLLALVALIGGLTVVGAHLFVRDDDGFYTSGNEQLRSDSYAILTEDIDLTARAADWAPDELLGALRFRAEGSNGTPVFLGIARTSDLERYLGGVAHSEVTDFDGEPRYDEHPGRFRATPPGNESFWAAQSEGAGEQAVQWEAEAGNWTAVAMNADASRGIAVEADAGVQIGWLIWVGLGLSVFGLLLGGAAVMLIVSIRRAANAEQ